MPTVNSKLTTKELIQLYKKYLCVNSVLKLKLIFLKNAIKVHNSLIENYLGIDLPNELRKRLGI